MLTATYTRGTMAIILSVSSVGLYAASSPAPSTTVPPSHSKVMLMADAHDHASRMRCVITDWLRAVASESRGVALSLFVSHACAGPVPESPRRARLGAPLTDDDLRSIKRARGPRSRARGGAAAPAPPAQRPLAVSLGGRGSHSGDSVLRLGGFLPSYAGCSGACHGLMPSSTDRSCQRRRAVWQRAAAAAAKPV